MAVSRLSGNAVRRLRLRHRCPVAQPTLAVQRLRPDHRRRQALCQRPWACRCRGRRQRRDRCRHGRLCCCQLTYFVASVVGGRRVCKGEREMVSKCISERERERQCLVMRKLKHVQSFSQFLQYLNLVCFFFRI